MKAPLPSPDKAGQPRPDVASLAPSSKSAGRRTELSGHRGTSAGSEARTGAAPKCSRARLPRLCVKASPPRPHAEPAYHLHSCPSAPPLGTGWSDPAWQLADTAQVEHFLTESSAHRPQTRVRVLYSRDGLHGMFRVRDRYVRCVRTKYFEPVYKDSCVEFFVQPKSGQGYFNFEFNCGGAYLCNYITDSTLVNGRWKASVPVPATLGEKVSVKTSLPRIVEPEISRPVCWTLQFFIPFCFFEEYVGPLGSLPGQVWRGNFFKCASEVSHPHWAAWSPVPEFNFHLPRCFGWLLFDP